MIKLTKKILAHARLLINEPDVFFRNVQAKLHPGAYLNRLKDISEITPLNIEIDNELAANPRVVVLLPTVSASASTGGPNTVFMIAARLARAGHDVVIVGTEGCRSTSGEMRAYMEQLVGKIDRGSVSVFSAVDRSIALRVGPLDVFCATFWTTAYLAQAASKQTRIGRFLYVIQDFEPGFYNWSSDFALSEATYRMDFVPIINEAYLLGYLKKHLVGRFADAAFANGSIVFEPSVGRDFFFSEPRRASLKRLVFYARPNNPRNLFGMALDALILATKDPVFATGWEFVAVGSDSLVPGIELGQGNILKLGPWMGFEAYAAFMRQSDIMLCPMLSPHTSYPTLEMLSCGGITVTTVFDCKSQESLLDISADLLSAAPNSTAIAEKLVLAAGRILDKNRQPAIAKLHDNWDSALVGVIAQVDTNLADMRRAAATGVVPMPDLHHAPGLESDLSAGTRTDR